MSTKSSIAYGVNFHLYREVFDDDFVYLELEGVQFEASYNRVLVPIPVHIWEFIRQHPGVDLGWVDKTDAEIAEHVEHEVDQRLERFKEMETGKGGLVRILGSMLYGKADEPREKQIESGVLHFTKLRQHQQQIRKAIEDLKRKAEEE